MKAPQFSPGNSMWSCGACQIDARRGQLIREGRQIHIRPKAWALLLSLLEQPNILIGAAELSSELWPRQSIDPRALTNLISELRTALGDPHALRTVHRRGFILSAQKVEHPPGHFGPVSTAPRCEQLSDLPIVADVELEVDDFVVRGNAMEELRAVANASLAGRLQVVELFGAAGVGKTTVLNRWLNQLRREQVWTVVTGRAYDLVSEPEPFGPLITMFGELAADRRAGISVSDFRMVAPCWLAQYPNLLSPEDFSGLLLELNRAGVGRMLREGVALVMQMSAASPLVMSIEDVQWADGATLDWINLLTQSVMDRPILLIVTRRTGPSDTKSDSIFAQHAGSMYPSLVQSIELKCFTVMETQEYLRKRKIPEDFSVDLANRLHEITAGLPLFVKLAVDDVSERNSITSGGFTLAGGARVDSRLTRHLKDRSERLSRLHRSILDICCCVAVPMPVPLMADVLGRDESVLHSSCEDLVRFGFLRMSDESTVWVDDRPVSSYGFAHDLMGKFFWRELQQDLRVALNRNLAKALGSAAKFVRSDWSTHLALAYMNGEMIEEAVEELRRSCGRALGRFAVRSAGASLKEALRYLNRLTPTTSVKELRLEILWDLSRLLILHTGTTGDEIDNVRDELILHGEKFSTPRSNFLTAYTRCTRQIYGGRGDQAASSAETLRQSADKLGAYERALANMWVGLAASTCGRLNDARAAYEACIGLMPSGTSNAVADLRVSSAIYRCWTLAMLGQIDAFTLEAEAIEAEVASYRSSYLEAIAHYWIGDALRQLGCNDAAIARFIALRGLCKFHDIEIFRIQAEISYHACISPSLRCLPQLQELIEISAAKRRRFGEYLAVIAAIEASIAQGLPDEAQRLLHTYRHIRRYWPFHRSEVLRLEGDMQFLNGSASSAFATWKSAIEVDLHGGFAPGLIRTLLRFEALQSQPPLGGECLRSIGRVLAQAVNFKRHSLQLSPLVKRLGGLSGLLSSCPADT